MVRFGNWFPVVVFLLCCHCNKEMPLSGVGPAKQHLGAEVVVLLSSI